MQLDREQKMIIATLGTGILIGGGDALLSIKAEKDAAQTFPFANTETEIRSAHTYRDSFTSQIKNLTAEGKINEIRAYANNNAANLNWPILNNESDVLAQRATIKDAREKYTFPGFLISAILTGLGFGLWESRKSRLSYESKKGLNQRRAIMRSM